MKKLDDIISFSCGVSMKNRFMLAPLTNSQSYEDGRLSDEEFHWLTMRAKGQFGLVMTCASHVQEIGKGFPGQLGIFDDIHIEGHTKLAKEIKETTDAKETKTNPVEMRTFLVGTCLVTKNNSSPKKITEGIIQIPSSLVISKNPSVSPSAMLCKMRDLFDRSSEKSNRAAEPMTINNNHGYIMSLRSLKSRAVY